MLTDTQTEALVNRAKHGDPDALQELASAFMRAAYAVALAVVRRPADAEDVAQDAFVIAIERVDSCREPAHFARWLLQIVRNQARNWLARRRLRDVPASDQLPEQASENVPALLLRGRLLAALDALSLAQREVVLLHDLEGWTHPEISATLGISEVMSRQHLFLARRELRAQLRDDTPRLGGES